MSPTRFADEPDEEQQALEDIDMLLNRTRPKHFREGVASGVGYVVAGAVGACGIVMLSPAAGAKAGYTQTGDSLLGGVVGGVVGGTVGAGSALSVAAGGLLVGVAQVARGTLNTPSSIVEPRRGKWWNVNEGKWILTHMGSEREWIATQPKFDEDILGEKAITDQPDHHTSTAEQWGVVEMGLYDLLGVSPNAETFTIERQYYQRAKKLRRPGVDANKADQKLEELNRAYLILTSDELRDEYNQGGLSAVVEEDTTSADPLFLYGILYGSEKFEDWTGRLAAASAQSIGLEQVSNVTLVQARLLQKRRVTRLAIKMADRLQPWIQNDQDQARTDWEEAARGLCDSSYGSLLVHLLGQIYSSCARQFLGSFDSGLGMPSLRQWAETRKLAFVRATEEAEQRLQKMQNPHLEREVRDTVAAVNEEDPNVRQEVATKLYETAGSDILNVLWQRTTIDITNTLYEALQMVFYDRDLNDDTRRLRGEGVDVLGRIFLDANYAQSEESLQAQRDYEEIAFYAVLDTVRRQEVATRSAPSSS